VQQQQQQLGHRGGAASRMVVLLHKQQAVGSSRLFETLGARLEAAAAVLVTLAREAVGTSGVNNARSWLS
jgi:hypothetical protein